MRKLVFILLFAGVLSAQTSSPCDVNHDGKVDSVDMNLAVNQVLGINPCTINGSGTCTIIDVQRIVVAALGGTCGLSASSPGGTGGGTGGTNSGSTGGSIINITPADSYSKVEGAKPGDTVVFAPGTYHYRLELDTIATASAPITLRALDLNNRPVFDFTGQVAQLFPGSNLNGDSYRGCWQIRGAYYIIDGFVIKGCNGIDGNSAGIRYVKASSLTIRHTLFQNNQNGIFGGGDNILLEYCEFDRNGNPSNDQEHNIYVLGGASFTLRYSYVHDAQGGQNFHMRARNSVLEYNWFVNAADYEGDMMTASSGYDSAPAANNTQTMLLRGNVFYTALHPGNETKVLTLFNDNLAPGTVMNLTAVWNTFIVNSAAVIPAVLQIRNDTMSSSHVVFSNNIVTRATKFLVLGAPSTLNYTSTGVNNLFALGATVGLTKTVFGSNPGFANPSSGNYTLAATSLAKNAADITVANAPTMQANLIGGVITVTPRSSIHDIGALD